MQSDKEHIHFLLCIFYLGILKLLLMLKLFGGEVEYCPGLLFWYIFVLHRKIFLKMNKYHTCLSRFLLNGYYTILSTPKYYYILENGIIFIKSMSFFSLEFFSYLC